ncbi:acetyl-CoA carboxylase biotin carboxylase subunit [Cytobacillus firmus]|uniref:Acetyl-CoA carboxylase biotin carboxylase subunit n=2 Tax=Cytobacillus TaxID=2675230 RepID=A0A366K1F3_CYTFI|nr:MULTISPECIES: biotin carboxylase N-terminal domain-containing protein [Cytobacillus]RBP95132.1 acetyl-CoA carboxylase biotin carboxylase subunit [Cytobacillus firmus]TDX43973.1 acetyl-CoA carboxylase biotin carboxylase subunit [Cytobacillus oceanisediminis]
MRKVLIANRGEIALRIIKTCRKMEIETVAIYSDADKDLPFVKEATYAFRIGEPPVNKSYLKSEAILEIAKRENVDGIHPGYGFLSENSVFARAVIDAGMAFIGPDPETIELMGDKIVSRNTMKEAGVPIVPGSGEGTSTIEEACRLADSMGYPVMLKASGGGGGIGMVRCENEQALAKSFDSTKARAKAYFGSDEVFVEKYIENARHVEIQVFGDHHGNIVHLFERDCSIQRRHQKVVEESPSPFLSEQTKQKMYDTALTAAKAVNYKNAGTIEFIVDEQENFYFLEMNTRLQVEHPVTEQVTGLDLVEWQLLAARGEKLPLQQNSIKQVGHSIEFRLYAEDPVSFMPSPGKLSKFEWTDAPGIRVDYGYASNTAVSPFYDPMIAKCIIFGQSRDEAIENALQFFDGLGIEGIKTNAPLFKGILKDEDFRKGNYSTSFLAQKAFAVN